MRSRAVAGIYTYIYIYQVIEVVKNFRVLFTVGRYETLWAVSVEGLQQKQFSLYAVAPNADTVLER